MVTGGSKFYYQPRFVQPRTRLWLSTILLREKARNSGVYSTLPSTKAMLEARGGLRLVIKKADGASQKQ